MTTFIGGDPRFLSGGVGAGSIHYNSELPRVNDGAGVDFKAFDKACASFRARGYVRDEAAYRALASCGISVHAGRSGYHDRPSLNAFCRPGEDPTAGVELEMEERSDDLARKAMSYLRSNWFHFESDSSLHTSRTEGYELITEPLPPRVYRDLGTWIGLQNLVAPYFESYSYSNTGLHVHVGLEQFRNCEAMPFVHPSDRETLGKHMAVCVYFSLVDRAVSDRVFLRRNTGYCLAPEGVKIPASLFKTAADFTWLSLSSFLDRMGASDWRSVLNSAVNRIGRIDSGGDLRGFAANPLFCRDAARLTGHGTEVNCGHQHTVEFRRGKGTVNAVSIHRMVEFATLVVRFAKELVEHPDMPLGPNSAAEYMMANTTSDALKSVLQEGAPDVHNS